MKKETGGPAFPVLHQNEITGYIPPETSGMTLRDYFAAKAMQSIIQARTTLIEKDYPDDSYEFAASCGMHAEMDLRREDGSKYKWIELVAEEAYECADAMLKARGT